MKENKRRLSQFLSFTVRHRDTFSANFSGETPTQIPAATGVPARNFLKWNQLADDLEKAVPHHKKSRAPDEPELDAGTRDRLAPR